jgi:hypothetical protein
MIFITFGALFDFLIALETWLDHFNLESKEIPRTLISLFVTILIFLSQMVLGSVPIPIILQIHTFKRAKNTCRNII